MDNHSTNYFSVAISAGLRPAILQIYGHLLRFGIAETSLLFNTSGIRANVEAALPLQLASFAEWQNVATENAQRICPIRLRFISARLLASAQPICKKMIFYRALTSSTGRPVSFAIKAKSNPSSFIVAAVSSFAWCEPS